MYAAIVKVISVVSDAMTVSERFFITSSILNALKCFRVRFLILLLNRERDSTSNFNSSNHFGESVCLSVMKRTDFFLEKRTVLWIRPLIKNGLFCPDSILCLFYLNKMTNIILPSIKDTLFHGARQNLLNTKIY